MSMSLSIRRNGLLCLVTILLFMTAAAQNRSVSARQQALTLLKRNLPATGLNQSALKDYVVTDAYTDKKTAT